MINQIDRESVKVDTSNVIKLGDTQNVQLYFPVDRMGNVVDRKVATRLECWACTTEEVRQKAPDILGEGWNHALTRVAGHDVFGRLALAVAGSSIAVVISWSKSLQRFPEGDLDFKEK